MLSWIASDKIWKVDQLKYCVNNSNSIQVPKECWYILMMLLKGRTTFMFHRFFTSQVKSWYLGQVLLSSLSLSHIYYHSYSSSCNYRFTLVIWWLFVETDSKSPQISSIFHSIILDSSLNFLPNCCLQFSQLSK